MVASGGSERAVDPVVLSGRTMVVTGGARGIGAAVVRMARERGARVAVLDVESVPADLEVDCFARCDVSRSEDVQRAFATVRRVLGSIDALVNNAGIAPPGRFDDLTEEVWQRTLAIDLTGVFLCTQQALPELRARRGSVTNIGSIAGRHRSFTASVAYAAAKGGVIALTRQLGHELAPDGVRVNCVCPGLVDTEIIRHNVSESRRAELESAVPLGRLATAEEIAAVTCFLASAAASYLTGAIVDVNGGLY
jgi:NAD(P)-dependent dehydrogenase (short-subunit alcohol dehydrogenase family)